MSESMTVEQALSFVRVVREVPELKSSPGRSLKSCMVLADEVERLKARVAELEAEKWNAQIAETALASVEQERDELRRRFNSLMSMMIRISKSSRDEGGCYYTNRENIRLACDAVKANQIEGGA